MRKCRIIIFNVEHGFCAFIRSPNDYALLIDCGRTDTFSPVRHIIDHELAGINQFEGSNLAKFILTHPHDDHLADIDLLKAEISPARIKAQAYEWDEVKQDAELDYESLDSYVELRAGYSPPAILPPIDFGMQVSHPAFLSPSEAKKIDEYAFINNSSIPVFVEYAGRKIVFPGDLEVNGWQELLKQNHFHNTLKGCCYFVTSHHGHSSGYCKEIFDYMGKPEFNIVSAHLGDDSVESAYSSSNNARGISIQGERRFMFSTRYDGHIVLEIYENGAAVIDFPYFEDNI